MLTLNQRILLLKGPVSHPYALLVTERLLDGITSHGLAFPPHLVFHLDFARIHVLDLHKFFDSKDFSRGHLVVHMKDGLPASVNPQGF